MARTYIVKQGDTLSKIAKRFYDDTTLAPKLGEFNGLRDPNLLMVGQQLEVPSRSELLGQAPAPAPPAGGLATPNGLQEIITTFGNIFDLIGADGSLDPRWETVSLDRAIIPFPLILSFDHSKKVTRFQCHKLLTGIFTAVFTDIQNEGLQAKVTSFGGCFNYRAKRTSSKLSAHCWGIAIDLNTETNAQGTAGNMDAGVVKVFQDHGFKWGGEFSGKSKDPMHFQFCTGY